MLTLYDRSLGPWTEKAPEAPQCAILMDARQAERYLRAYQDRISLKLLAYALAHPPLITRLLALPLALTSSANASPLLSSSATG